MFYVCMYVCVHATTLSTEPIADRANSCYMFCFVFSTQPNTVFPHTVIQVPNANQSELAVKIKSTCKYKTTLLYK